MATFYLDQRMTYRGVELLWNDAFNALYSHYQIFVIISSITVLLNLLAVTLPTCFKFIKIEENQTDVNDETSQKDSSTVKFVRSLMCQRVVGVPESKVSTFFNQCLTVIVEITNQSFYLI